MFLAVLRCVVQCLDCAVLHVLSLGASYCYRCCAGVDIPHLPVARGRYIGRHYSPSAARFIKLEDIHRRRIIPRACVVDIVLDVRHLHAAFNDELVAVGSSAPRHVRFGRARRYDMLQSCAL